MSKLKYLLAFIILLALLAPFFMLATNILEITYKEASDLLTYTTIGLLLFLLCVILLLALATGTPASPDQGADKLSSGGRRNVPPGEDGISPERLRVDVDLGQETHRNMRRQAADSAALVDRLRAFILGAGWVQTRRARSLSFFSPPSSLGIRGNYTIALPDDPAQQNVGSLIYDAADALVQVYGYSRIGDLLNRSASLSDLDRPTRIISRFLDDSTKAGAIPLAALVSYVSNMEATLYRSAKFRLGADSKAADLAAKQFANDCYFLQTDVGSFVAKVEIPATILRQADLFGTPLLDSTEVTSSLFAAIQFLNEQILGTDITFDDKETLSNAISLFDVELLTAIADVLLGPELESIDFSFEFGNRVRTTSTGCITPEKRDRLKNFVEFVTEQLRCENNIDE